MFTIFLYCESVTFEENIIHFKNYEMGSFDVILVNETV